MSSHASGGKCLACGKASTLRCSSCANKGGIDLFFCSRAHQKLVWPYHRLVCGERAHPFRLPVYSQEEADVLLKRLREPANTPELGVLQEKMRAAVEAHDGSESDLKEKIQSLVGQEGSLAPNREPAADSQSTASLIRELRLLSWQWYAKIYLTGDTRHVVQHFVEHMTTRYDSLTKDCPPVDLSSLWHSRFCHHAMAPMPIQAASVRTTDPAMRSGDKFVPLEDVRSPDILKAILDVDAAYRALNKFLEATQSAEHATSARVVHFNSNKPDPELCQGRA